MAVAGDTWRLIKFSRCVATEGALAGLARCRKAVSVLWFAGGSASFEVRLSVSRKDAKTQRGLGSGEAAPSLPTCRLLQGSHFESGSIVLSHFAPLRLRVNNKRRRSSAARTPYTPVIPAPERGSSFPLSAAPQEAGPRIKSGVTGRNSDAFLPSIRGDRPAELEVKSAIVWRLALPNDAKATQ